MEVTVADAGLACKNDNRGCCEDLRVEISVPKELLANGLGETVSPEVAEESKRSRFTIRQLGARSLRANTASNLVARAWTAGLAIICVPQYLRLMGVEAYGLVGFFSSAQLLLAFFDFGLGATLNRELAMASVTRSLVQNVRHLARTLESIYWSVALILGVAWIALAPWLSHSWIHAKQIAPGQVQWAITLMGLVLIFQWPFNLYLSGLMGMQHQVLANAVLMVVATLRSFGAVAALWVFTPTVRVFFTWQAVVAVPGTAAIALVFWKWLPRGSPAHFSLGELRRVSDFSTGLIRISAVSLLLSNLDKILLSRLLPLESFGYYMLAMTVASGLYVFASALYGALYPRFSQYYASGDSAKLAALYHCAAQGLTVALGPLALCLALFPREALLLWTGNEATALRAGRVLTVLLMACMLNALMYMPYALTLSHGWTSFLFKLNFVAVVLFVPLLLILVRWYGAVGAAGAYLMLNAGYVFIAAPLMHRRLLCGQFWNWFIGDVTTPLAAALAPILAIRLAAPQISSRYSAAMLLTLAFATAFITSCFAARLVLSQAVETVRRLARTRVPRMTPVN
ncbi:MAG TPA: oligosaccharide flippase family protein [Bryobacteraceae bacterium]|nr:oligosaccharide flippase family protein [Bryobacteraceae bacterium]